jgi:hypothetical protein
MQTAASSSLTGIDEPRRMRINVSELQHLSAADREKIARRAYEIYEAEGRVDGQNDDHWYRAEREFASAARLGLLPTGSVVRDDE